MQQVHLRILGKPGTALLLQYDLVCLFSECNHKPLLLSGSNAILTNFYISIILMQLFTAFPVLWFQQYWCIIAVRSVSLEQVTIQSNIWIMYKDSECTITYHKNMVIKLPFHWMPLVFLIISGHESNFMAASLGPGSMRTICNS